MVFFFFLADRIPARNNLWGVGFSAAHDFMVRWFTVVGKARATPSLAAGVMAHCGRWEGRVQA